MLSKLAQEALVIAYLSRDEGLRQEWDLRYAGFNQHLE